MMFDKPNSLFFFVFFGSFVSWFVALKEPNGQFCHYLQFVKNVLVSLIWLENNETKESSH